MTQPSWATWRAQAHFVDDDHGRGVASYDLGEPGGSALTFLHGYPSASIDIAPVQERLGDAWRILAVDFPGFGASAKPPGHRHTIHAAADAIERLWADRGVERTLVLAHDYGVSVGQELLARRTDGTLDVELTGIVWTNGGLYPDLHRASLGQQLLLDPEHRAELAAGMTEEPFTQGLANTWGTRVPLDTAALHEIWASMEDGGGHHLMHELLHYIADRREHADRWRAALEESDLPMRFVWGDVDPVSGAHMIERVEERLPDAPVVRFADGGHWPPLEVPDAVAAAVHALAG